MNRPTHSVPDTTSNSFHFTTRFPFTCTAVKRQHWRKECAGLHSWTTWKDKASGSTWSDYIFNTPIACVVQGWTGAAQVLSTLGGLPRKSHERHSAALLIGHALGFK